MWRMRRCSYDMVLQLMVLAGVALELARLMAIAFSHYSRTNMGIILLTAVSVTWRSASSSVLGAASCYALVDLATHSSTSSHMDQSSNVQKQEAKSGMSFSLERQWRKQIGS